MQNYITPDLAITGIGVTSAIGQGKDAFFSSLVKGEHAFGVMQRPGRQRGSAFLGAEISSINYPADISRKALRTASFSGEVALVTLHEAWKDANLDDTDPKRIGLVVGGSNFQQRQLITAFESYANRVHFLRPTYGLSFMDTDLCGLCTEQFGIKGLAMTVGGSSASGQLAVIQAVQAIQAGQLDVCIALGALMDISFLECQALRSLGAMGSDRYSDQPALACRPFDKQRDGFIYGECCGAVVIENRYFAKRPKVRPYAFVSGWAIVMDGNRNPDPCYEGEVQAIRNALQCAKLSPSDIDYINPHGSGSVIGDEIELQAIVACGLSHAHINATKSIVGHGLSAAGTVEIIATLLQMKESRLHPTRNLKEPIEPRCNWVGDGARTHRVRNAINLSFGFGGLNTAICLRNSPEEDGHHDGGN